LQTDTGSAAPQRPGDNRRVDARHTPIMRAAVWFNLGSEIGDTCGLKDVSMSGFSIRCNEWQLPVFTGTEGKTLYCVLLMGEAHFGCMAHMVNSPITHTGHVGFCFDAVPAASIRLLQGLIDCMAVREASSRGETTLRDLT
jgi:hypothetical protein